MWAQALLLSVLCILPGCATTAITSYPDDWPSIARLDSSECADVIGRYRLSAKKSAQPPNIDVVDRLDGILWGKYLDDFSPDALVNVSYSADKRHLILSLPAQPSSSKPGYTQLEGGFSCQRGWLQVTTRSTFSTEGTRHSTESFAELRKLADGSLIVHVRTIRSSNTLFVLGYGDDVESWHIFERVR